MAKRLTEEDVRRIFREEIRWFDEDRRWNEKFQRDHPEEYATWLKIEHLPVEFGPEMVRDVVKAYWEVVEEGLNER